MDIRIKKTWAFAPKSLSTSIIENQSPSSLIASMPEKIPFVFPRILVKPGDHVDIGTPLFEDKKRTYLKFLSPAGGLVRSIIFGPRRVIREIIIDVDSKEQHVKFRSYDISDISRINQKELIDHLVAGGIWPYIRELPFRKIADPYRIPTATWVHLDSPDPYHPLSEHYLKENTPSFELGIAALKKLSPMVNVCQNASNYQENSEFGSYVTHRIIGGYPSNDPGVIVYHTKKSAMENRSWFIAGQDVLMIGRFLLGGIYPTERMVSVSQPDVGACFYVRTRIGAPLSQIIPFEMSDPQYRWLSGGIFAGSVASRDSFLSLYDTSLAVLPASQKKEFFGFLRPGYNKLSLSRTFLSVFNRNALPRNNDMHGEERACINCGTCAKVCPVDILPQFLYKSLFAQEVEEALQHGLLDCVECGICSFACPSKIELSESFIAAKHDHCLEQG